jgi:hypothetical protein
VVRAIEDRAALECSREAVSAKSTIVCRLIENVGTMRWRAKRRESGVLQDQFIARVAKLKCIWMVRDWRILALPATIVLVTQIAHEMRHR